MYFEPNPGQIPVSMVQFGSGPFFAFNHIDQPFVNECTDNFVAKIVRTMFPLVSLVPTDHGFLVK